MAGTYIQRRALPPVGTTYWGRLNPDGSMRTPTTWLDTFSSQVTTSFRTGKGESLVSPDELRDSNSYLNNLLTTENVEYDTGHAFTTVKKEAFIRAPVTVSNRGRYGIYTTPFVSTQMVALSSGSYPVIPKWDTADADGNQAILKTYPTAPNASLLQMVAELKKEGLPSLFGLQTYSMKGSAARSLGGEYLNVAFGWTPLISDLDKLLKSVVSSSKTIQQMQRDSGKVVRRKRSFPTVREMVQSTETNEAARALPDSGSPFYGHIGKLITEETRTTEMWFSGAYTYFLDPGENLVGKAIMYEQLANKLLGTRLTPSVLWELAPWSWLADWYANIGDNLAVAGAFQSDGLTLKYGYLMRKVTAEIMYTFIPDAASVSAGAQVSRLILRTTSKERVKSSPFGFGIKPVQYTDRQVAILGALAFAKSPKGMRAF